MSYCYSYWILSLPIYFSLTEQAAEAIADRILLIREAVVEFGYPAWCYPETFRGRT